MKNCPKRNTSEPKWWNCGGNHAANSMDCPMRMQQRSTKKDIRIPAVPCGTHERRMYPKIDINPPGKNTSYPFPPKKQRAIGGQRRMRLSKKKNIERKYILTYFTGIMKDFVEVDRKCSMEIISRRIKETKEIVKVFFD